MKNIQTGLYGMSLNYIETPFRGVIKKAKQEEK